MAKDPRMMRAHSCVEIRESNATIIDHHYHTDDEVIYNQRATLIPEANSLISGVHSADNVVGE